MSVPVRILVGPRERPIATIYVPNDSGVTVVPGGSVDGIAVDTIDTMPCVRGGPAGDRQYLAQGDELVLFNGVTVEAVQKSDNFIAE